MPLLPLSGVLSAFFFRGEDETAERGNEDEPGADKALSEASCSYTWLASSLPGGRPKMTSEGDAFLFGDTSRLSDKR